MKKARNGNVMSSLRASCIGGGAPTRPLGARSTITFVNMERSLSSMALMLNNKSLHVCVWPLREASAFAYHGHSGTGMSSSGI
jgi:hypothetical protein